MFTKKFFLSIVISSLLMLFSFNLLAAAEEKPAAEVKAAVTSEASKSPVAPVPAPAAAATEERPTGDFTVAALSQYIWRGYELSRDSIVLQPSATIAYKGFSANIWGNLDTKPYFAGTGDTNYPSAWNETDLTLAYTKTLGLFNLGAGYIYYALGPLNKDAPDRADAQEVFATVSLNTILSPTLTAYKEISSYRNWYFLLGISHVFDSIRPSLKLAASASYLLIPMPTPPSSMPGYAVIPNSTAMPGRQTTVSNFHDGTLTVSLPIKATGYITITPTISYVFPLSDDAKNEMKGSGLKGVATAADRDSSFLYGGLSFSFSF